VSVSSPSIGICGFSAMPGAYSLTEMDDVRIQAGDHTLEFAGEGSYVTMRVRSSYLNGGPVDLSNGGNLTCMANYDENDIFYGNTCP
jgi:hypothetical protein